MKLASNLVLALALSAPACAPSLTGQLRGPGGEPVTSDEARVNIVSLTPGRAATHVVEVDGAGRFESSESLAPGPYMVEALVPGYGLASRRVVVGEAESVELLLEPLPQAKARAIGANLEAERARGAGGATLTPPNL